MEPSEETVRVVLITAPNVQVGTNLARVLVDERLAACVNVVSGVRSIYRWGGAVSEDAEVLLVVKTTTDCSKALAARVLDLHPYDVPEVVELAAVGGSAAYLDWVRMECLP